jgi:hypothetical protein
MGPQRAVNAHNGNVEALIVAVKGYRPAIADSHHFEDPGSAL